MNYFIKENEKLIQKLNYEIDKSPALCKDMVKFWNKRVEQDSFKEQQIGELRYDGAISEFLNKKSINLTCDYIGPSRYIAEEKRELSIADILEYYIPSREFGGHMIWPSQEIEIRDNCTIKKSMNTARSYCFKERIDYALFEIKNWFENSKAYVEVFRNVLNGNADWLKQFGNFQGFIDFFMFNAFMDGEYNIYDLSSYNGRKYNTVITGLPKIKFTTKEEYSDNLIESYIPKNYREYIAGCLVAINSRNKDIRTFLAK